MVIIGELAVPEEGVIYTSKEVKLRIDQTAIDNGILYITESAFSWKPDNREEGISIPWPKISLHGIQNANGIKQIHILLDFTLEWPGVYDGSKQKNGNAEEEEEDEDKDEGNESEDSTPDITLLWLEPKDPHSVEQIFEAMKHCQSLHPDEADSISEEDDDDFMEAEDAEYEYEGDMRNLHIEDEDKFADANEE